MNRYFVSELYPNAKYTAGALREDIETTLNRCRYEKLDTLPASYNILNRLLAYPDVRKKARSLRAPALVFFHFPLRSRINRYFFDQLQLKKIRTIAYVHDFEGLRDQDKSILKAELELLSRFDLIIAQNPAMKQFIEKETQKKAVVVLGMYDYLDLLSPEDDPSPGKPIVFAGNLEKAPFVNKLGEIKGLVFNVYGEQAFSSPAANTVYKGKADPRLLAATISKEGSYGLVWDGSSLETGQDAGAYLRINLPHKLALYIMAGLPPIVWKESAMSGWVEENQVGLTVNSLYELPAIIQLVTNNQYRLFQENMRNISGKMREGYFLEMALRGAEQYIS